VKTLAHRCPIPRTLRSPNPLWFLLLQPAPSSPPAPLLTTSSPPTPHPTPRQPAARGREEGVLTVVELPPRSHPPSRRSRSRRGSPRGRGAAAPFPSTLPHDRRFAASSPAPASTISAPVWIEIFGLHHLRPCRAQDLRACSALPPHGRCHSPRRHPPPPPCGHSRAGVGLSDVSCRICAQIPLRAPPRSGVERTGVAASAFHPCVAHARPSVH
jgi:hypothetical protein